AYQVVGDGPVDLVYANSFMGHIEVSWEYARAARFYERMSSFCRLVLFDRRGTGLSDPIVESFPMGGRVSDIAPVMAAVGFERAVLLGSSEGATAGSYFAALHPQRVSALVLFSPYITVVEDEECPWGLPHDFLSLFDDDVQEPAWTIETAAA